MKEGPRDEDEACVTSSRGSGASACRDWARAGRGARMLGSDVSQNPLWGGVQDQVLSSCN